MDNTVEEIARTEEVATKDVSAQPDAKADSVEEVVVTIGEEPPPQESEVQHAPEWVRELRKNHRELLRENRALREQVQAKTEQIAVGAKPQLEDFDYDAEKFEHALIAWHDRNQEEVAHIAEAENAQREQHRAWQAKLDDYGRAKAELKVKDYEDAETTVLTSLNVTQQGIIVQGAENPALVIYALGKNPKKAAELAEINDPVKFAFAIAKLEGQLKVTDRKAVPPPEKTLSGHAPKSGTIDSTLERLRSEAEKTGDYTKVTNYKRQQRAAA